MKTIATAMILACLPSTAMAQAKILQKPVLCAPIKGIIAELAKEFGETPVLIAPQEHGKSSMAFFANTEKNTWTLVEMDQKNGCIIGSGADYRMIKPGRDT
jgi:hypothetical protein